MFAVKMKGCVEELSNFTFLVLAAVALFRICVFRSVSRGLLYVFFKEKYVWVFKKVSILYYSVINLTRLKSALAALIE